MRTAVAKTLTLKALLPGFLLLVCCHLSLGQNVRLSNTSMDVGKGRYKWTLFVDADDSVLSSIQYVVYNLHPAFDKPERKVDRPRVGPRAFSTSDIAFRPSKMYALIYFTDGRTMRFEYTLRLRSSFAKSWYVVLGSSAVSQRDNLDALLAAYHERGVSAYIIDTNSGDFPNFDRGLWMLVLGPTTQTEALRILRKTPSLGSREPYVRQAARY
jgi:hypothetical protein